jgi:hypothetical protein
MKRQAETPLHAMLNQTLHMLSIYPHTPLTRNLLLRSTLEQKSSSIFHVSSASGQSIHSLIPRKSQRYKLID